MGKLAPPRQGGATKFGEKEGPLYGLTTGDWLKTLFANRNAPSDFLYVRFYEVWIFTGRIFKLLGENFGCRVR